MSKNKLLGFLKDDIDELSKDKELMNYEKLETFVFYWQQHINNLK